jgi:hypothetical protein
VTLTAARLERLFDEQDEAEARGDQSRADAKRLDWEALLDDAALAIPRGPDEINHALDLAASLASDPRGIRRCVQLHRAGPATWRLLATLRHALACCPDTDLDGSYVAQILANVLRSLTTLRIIEGGSHAA